MPADLIKKNIKLSMEFDNYISKSPTAFRRIPKGAHIVLTSSKDKKLSEANMTLMRNTRTGKFVLAHKSESGWSLKPLKR
jgi:hypothetical protein